MKRKNKPIKITYTYVKDDTSDFRVERAFDILFEEVKRRRDLGKLNIKNKTKE